jgi:ADP-ribosyl-[dinitrogen reductase] hydrolase
MTVDRDDRVLGCLIGGAIGDALGAGIEFMSWAEIESTFGPEGVRDFTPDYGHEAPITDDTQMTLFTAEGLLEAAANGTEPVEEVWAAYRRWYHTQGGDLPEGVDPLFGLLAVPELLERRGPGTTCMGSMRDDVPGTTDEPLNGSKGCGGIMRVAPVGLAATSDEEAYRLGCATAALTHGHASGWISAGAMAVMVRRLLEDEGLRDAVDAGRAVAAADPADFEVVDAIDAAIALVGQAPLRGTDLESLGKRWPGGPGDEALAIAVAAVLAEPDPNEALLLAVNHGGDSDSTGAIAGNLLGAHYGASALRTDWRERVELADVITEMAGRLSAVGGSE